ncbi:hypothetical protein AAMO2058_001552800 [Amorphochlora amoebiformis]
MVAAVAAWVEKRFGRGSWAEFYLVDGMIIVLSGILMHLLASAAARDSSTAVFALWVAFQSAWVVLVILMTWGLFKPKMWSKTQASISLVRAPFGIPWCTVKNTYRKHIILGMASYGIFSYLANLDSIERDATVFLYVCGIFRFVLLVYFVVWLPSGMFFAMCDETRDCSKENIVYWITFAYFIVTSAAPGFAVISLFLSQVMYILAQIVALAVECVVAWKKIHKTPWECVSIMMCSTHPYVLPFALMFTYIAIRRLSVFVLFFYLYFMVILSTAILIELLEMIEVEENRDLLQIIFFAIQIFAEFAITLLFYDSNSLTSASFWVLLLLVVTCDFFLESGSFHYYYYIWFKKDQSPRRRMVYFALKYQYIQQKILAETCALVTILFMVIIEVKGGERLKIRLLSRFLGISNPGNSIIYGYITLLLAHLTTIQASSRLLQRLMSRLKFEALAEMGFQLSSRNNSTHSSPYQANKKGRFQAKWASHTRHGPMQKADSKLNTEVPVSISTNNTRPTPRIHSPNLASGLDDASPCSPPDSASAMGFSPVGSGISKRATDPEFPVASESSPTAPVAVASSPAPPSSTDFPTLPYSSRVPSVGKHTSTLSRPTSNANSRWGTRIQTLEELENPLSIIVSERQPEDSKANPDTGSGRELVMNEKLAKSVREHPCFDPRASIWASEQHHEAMRDNRGMFIFSAILAMCAPLYVAIISARE